ncbi:MAG: hypothetical protein ABIQ38_09410 [Ilumatobacteraceae bacterium]
MPAIKFPTLPNIDLTKVDLAKVATKFRQASAKTEPVIRFAKDAAYVTVGVGVLTFQKTQVRRREITTAVKDSMPKITNEAIARAESAVSKVISLVNTRLPKKSATVVE